MVSINDKHREYRDMCKLNFVTPFIRNVTNHVNEDLINKIRMIKTQVEAEFDLHQPVHMEDQKLPDITFADIEHMMINAITAFEIGEDK